ncbi:MAG TPA: ATP-binding cassette domain-containing protein [Mycobacteriales bacterium]|nr:ATP-binding cassette domain-containing protein [Mycobacteriales bacterium]
MKIEARGLTKRYGTTIAVDDLSFDVLPGRVTGFLGPNGAGKSTTMRLVLGLDEPNAGTVTVNGKPYREHRHPLHEVGALLEARAIHGGRSAYNHLLCLAQSNGIPRSRIGEVLELVGLSQVAGKRVGGYSLGMGQRLGIAAALLGNPGILMFDEPINGLDPEGIRWVRNLLKGLAAEGRAVFVSSHLMSEMAVTADHLVVVGRGRLIASAAVEEFIRSSGQNYVRVRSPQAAELTAALAAAGANATVMPDGALQVIGLDCAGVGDIAARNGLTVHELLLQEASLEAAFMELTQDAVDFHAGAPAGAPVGQEA